MAEKALALRLADYLDSEFTTGRISNHMGRKAAAELRWLHDQTQMLDNAYQAACKVIRQQEKVNAELLEALENLEKEFRKVYPIYYYAEPWGHETNVPLQAARAAIKKVEGR